MSSNELPIIPALVPFLNGVPSHRPLVVIRRAEQHYKDLLEFLSETSCEYEVRGDVVLTKCHVELVNNKLKLIEAAIFELEHRTSALARAPFVGRVQKLKERLGECRGHFDL
ncbi:hypothetical protein BDU57DRAFT_305930 [Ampelomyces quisqualis]|uniref:Uncharacterized protein n=1 Tax=Ampelomyces quisqualis TaxID=50730 RepID=A0A6A5QH58_AMPQU|nr:hypothetical protein BDU57DRAFT_305930 [Ampelomyces quisqualis]